MTNIERMFIICRMIIDRFLKGNHVSKGEI